MQEPRINVDSDMAAMLCAAARNLAAVIAGLESMHAIQLGMQMPGDADVSSPRSSELSFLPQASTANSPEQPSFDAQHCNGSSNHTQEHKAATQRQLSLCIVDAAALVALGPKDCLQIYGTFSSADVARSWALPHVTMAMNGSSVFEGRDVELSLSKLAQTSGVVCDVIFKVY